MVKCQMVHPYMDYLVHVVAHISGLFLQYELLDMYINSFCSITLSLSMYYL